MVAAIKTIVTMITTSITPFEPRKIFLLVAGLVCFAVFPCFAAQPVLLSVPSTPYDHQMTRIQPVLTAKSDTAKETVSLTLVNHWIQNLREIPYGFTQEWKTPAEVETAAAADCKGKAVALYQMMHAHGAHNVRLVIGKRTATSKKTHAWLEWNVEGENYVLDPTINWAAYRATEIAGTSYQPLYAYAGSRKFRAVDAALVARN
jgi:predicted transglutaminase-like cysteine proteinase